MNVVAGAAEAGGTPLSRRLLRIVLWVGGAAPAIAVLDLLGIPISDWIGDLLDKVGDVPPWAIVAILLGAYGIPVASTTSPPSPPRTRSSCGRS